MKIEVNQTEENGVYSFDIQATFPHVKFGNKMVLDMNKETGLPYTKEQIDNAIGNCITDFIKIYEYEQKLKNEKDK